VPWLGVGLEQAGFYHFSSPDDGLGGRSAASLNFGAGDENFAGWLGGNIGYLYGDDLDDDAFAGPELGFSAKVAYDIPFNRDLDEGIIATSGSGSGSDRDTTQKGKGARGVSLGRRQGFSSYASLNSRRYCW